MTISSSENFTVFATQSFLDETKNLSEYELNIITRIEKKLVINPFVGKLLCPFLREKRIKEKRIYFLVFDDLLLVLLVAISGKKNQQATIDRLKLYLPEFRLCAEKLFKQHV